MSFLGSDYDEFGSYIGSADTEFDAENQQIPSEDNFEQQNPSFKTEIVDETEVTDPLPQIIFGDANENSRPVIKSAEVGVFALTAPDLLTAVDSSFLTGLLSTPLRLRCVSVSGAFHHGKSNFLDLMVLAAHPMLNRPEIDDLRWADDRPDEQKRGLSIKAHPMSLCLPDLSSRSSLIQFVDSPGHVNFDDEFCAATRLTDATILCVDAAEGILAATERVLRHAVREGLKIILSVTKLDRLILELKMPPTDCYFKLLQLIERVNTILIECGSTDRVSPLLNNVIFSSSKYRFAFSLESFAQLYYSRQSKSTNFSASAAESKSFALRLWGNQYFNPETRQFSSEPPKSNPPSRSFIQFLLEPIYKIFAHSIGSVDLPALKAFLPRVGVKLSRAEIEFDTIPMLKTVFSRFFGNSVNSVVQSIVDHCPSPVESGHLKRSRYYRGNSTNIESVAMDSCDPAGPLLIEVVKQYHSTDGKSFSSLGRIFSGSIRVGQVVRIMGEFYSLTNREDQTIQRVEKIHLPMGRCNIELNEARAGAIVLLSGLGNGILKTATITSTDSSVEKSNDQIIPFLPLKFNIPALMKLAVEPLKPSELPKLLDGMKKCEKSYPLASIKVESTGEHIIFGTGELYFDCLMHDLREIYSGIEIRVSDPVVKFTETVSETSFIKATAESPNKSNKLGTICTPMEEELSSAIIDGRLNSLQDERTRANLLQNEFHWDILSARSVWAFGPEAANPNLLIDETLPSETNKRMLFSVKDSIVQGFDWAAREGPLIDEPIRGVKFQLLEAQLASEPLLRARGQIIPAMKRAAQCAFLLAKPRLMEPIFAVEILSNPESIPAAVKVLQRRRGHIATQIPVPGSTIIQLNAFIPLIDSFGFETDLRSLTRGQSFCTLWFDHWKLVPGDPLDKSLIIRPLEAAPLDCLARDFMLKTRRRKGLSEDVAIGMLFDTELILKLAAKEAEKEREKIQMIEEQQNYSGNGNYFNSNTGASVGAGVGVVNNNFHR